MSDRRAPAAGVGDQTSPRPLSRDQRDPWGPFLRLMFWVGLDSFGGPVAQIGVMHRLAVDRRRWLSDSQFVHLLNFANILPGPEALEIVIHLGALRRGFWGGVAAGVLFIWPGFVCLTALAWVHERWGGIAAVAAFLAGIRPVAVALMGWAAVRLAQKSLRGVAAWVLVFLAFVAHFCLAVPFIALLLGCGMLGVATARFPAARRASTLQQPVAAVLLVMMVGLAWMGRTQSAADATRHDASGPASVTTAAAAPGRLAEIAWINTKAAFVTFGGAYTVLPYLREQVVQRHHWVSDVEMVDALALGETTPGPLISVGVFLSYLAGGFWGAVVGCVCLFLPSFVLVLALGPQMERIESLPRARDFLWGVSAGTLGLILSLSAHLMPRGIDDNWGLAIAGISFIALWRWQANVVATVLVGGALGLMKTWLR